MKNARPVQMQPKARAWVMVKASPYMNTPTSKVKVGEIYCKKPTIYNGTSLAQVVKSKSGVAVTTPENIKRPIISQPHFS
jgi:hypothetical protein